MADSEETKKGSVRSFAPGTFEHTRQNIGPLNAEEAMTMTKILGGEILPERSVPVDTSKMPRRTRRESSARAAGVSASDNSARSAALSSSMGYSSSSGSGSKNMQTNTSGASKRINTDADLPAVTARDLKMMNRLMQSSEYQIKPDYGVFNFLFLLSAKNKEKVTKDFAEYKVKKHVEHLQSFIGTVKTFIQLSPDTYKAKIATETELKFKFLRTVGKWSMRDIKILAVDVEQAADTMTVPILIPFVRSVYHELLTIYYIGEQQVPALIKEIYADITAYSNVDKDKMQNLAKQGITEWIYVYNQIIKGMYPLLMRMSSSDYVEFPQFFTMKIADILQFVGLSKFDLLLPEKKKKSEDEIKKEEEAKKKKEESQRHIAGKKDELVTAGIRLLEQLFPQAGFSRLDAHPDMYPYFQPLYKFPEGFNMLSQENGLQVTVVLLKIIDDLLHGCRNISFNIKADEKLGALQDSVTDAMGDWSFYLDDYFFKNYCDYLKNFMNSLYSQSDYSGTQYGKENINNLYWRAKLDFLPNLKFNAPTLSKPRSDSKYRPLAARTDYLRTVFTVLARRIDENSAGKKPVLGVMNPWARYNFDIPNVVSKRLDVLLGAKRDDATTAATNANLIKYTLCVVAVLDWWINNPDSPAYTADAAHFYRTGKDGSPEFSAQIRSDQNQLFADAVKKAVAGK